MSAILISILCPLVLEIVHTPPKQVYSDEPVKIYATISEEILTAHLLVEERSIHMEKDKRSLSATIPVEFVSPPYVKYRIVVKTRDNKTIRSPEYKVTVIEREEIIELIAPGLYESIKDKKPEIVLAFNSQIEISSVAILLDRIDITRECEIMQGSAYYKPDKELGMGEHTLEAVIKNVTHATYTFSIVPDKYVNGQGSAGLRYTTNDGSIDTDYLPYKPGFRVPFDIYASGSFYLPFSFWMYYDETTNFNLEVETPIAKISLGDIYPTGSLLTLYVASPRGIQLSLTRPSLPLDIELVAGELEHKDVTLCIDTLVDTFIIVDTVFVDIFVDTLIDTLIDTTFSGNYTRYLFGGSARWNLWNAKLGVSYFYGYDDSSSLGIEPHLLESALVEPPVINNFIAGEFEYPILRNFSVGAEYSVSNTHNIPSYTFEDMSQDTTGSAYLLFAKLENTLIDAKLTYNKIGKSYYTIGNPYLEAGKEGFLGEFSSPYKNMYYNGTYEVYQIYDTLEYNLYTSVNYTLWKFAPYIIHSMIGSSTSFTFGNRFGFDRGNISMSYGLGSNSNSFRGDCSCEIFKNKLNIKGGYGRSESLDSLGTNITLTQNSDFEIELMDMVALEYKGIFNKDYSSGEYSYEENIFTLRLKKRF